MEILVKKTDRCNYLLYLPEGYDKDEKKNWPLVLFMHGSGESGTDLSLVKTQGIPHLIDQGKQFPFIMVAPQIMEFTWWHDQLDMLKDLLDDVESNYRVDKNRIYLTGLSNGGYGTWALAAEQPDRFAAMVPICGGGDTRKAHLIKDIPTWVFHGDQDDTVPLKASQDMVDAVKEAGGNPKFTIYPGVGHGSWIPAYDEEELWKWLLEQHK